jgi:hypothetical protein
MSQVHHVTAQMNERQMECVFDRRLRREEMARTREDIGLWIKFTSEDNLSYGEQEGYDSDESHTLKTLLVGAVQSFARRRRESGTIRPNAKEEQVT